MRLTAPRLRLFAPAVLALAIALLCVNLAAGQGNPSDDPAFVARPVHQPAQVVDRINVVQTVDALFTQFDAKNWDAVGGLLADRVQIDFSSLGGARATVSRAELVDGWRRSFPEGKTSLHQTSNHQVRIAGDRAEVYMHGYAYNALPRTYGDDVWETWGTYRFSLQRGAHDRWLIIREQYTSLRTEGNEAVRDATGN